MVPGQKKRKMKVIKVTGCINCPFYCDDADNYCLASKESRGWPKEGVSPDCVLRKGAIKVELDE